MQVRTDRLRDDILTLAAIGRNPEDLGLYRVAFSPADMEGRRWLMEKMEALGLAVSMDGVGNVVGRLETEANKDKPTVLVGSHTDTVPCGGALDGALGVLGALECIRVIQEAKLELAHPVEVISFSDEEGRFGGMLGSQALIGDLTLEDVYQKADIDGNLLSEAMQAVGMDPLRILDVRRNPESIHAYLELHIEQGPVLEKERKAVGVVEGIAGLFKWSAKLVGSANHAGTTPMELRQDVFMGLADFANEIPRVLSEDGTPQSRATIGKVDLVPGFPHTIPGEVDFTLVVRDPKLDKLEELQKAFRKVLSAIARGRNLKFEYDLISWIDPIHSDHELVKVLEEKARYLKLEYKRMVSGAGHDAQFIARVAPTAMVFVPSKDGISHSPREWTDWEDIGHGTNLLLHALLEVAQGSVTLTQPQSSSTSPTVE